MMTGRMLSRYTKTSFSHEILEICRQLDAPREMSWTKSERKVSERTHTRLGLLDALKPGEHAKRTVRACHRGLMSAVSEREASSQAGWY